MSVRRIAWAGIMSLLLLIPTNIASANTYTQQASWTTTWYDHFGIPLNYVRNAGLGTFDSSTGSMTSFQCIDTRWLNTTTGWYETPGWHNFNCPADFNASVGDSQTTDRFDNDTFCGGTRTSTYYQMSQTSFHGNWVETGTNYVTGGIDSTYSQGCDFAGLYWNDTWEPGVYH